VCVCIDEITEAIEIAKALGSSALTQPGGKQALAYMLMDQYIDSLHDLSTPHDGIDMGNLDTKTHTQTSSDPLLLTSSKMAERT